MITTPHARPFAKPMIHHLAEVGVDLTKLVLYSTFDNNNRVTDVSGNENHGSLSNGAFIHGCGRYGKSLYLDAVDDQCTFANENNFDIGATEDFTIWQWSKAWDVGLSLIWAKGDTNDYYELSLAGASLGFSVDDGILATKTAGGTGAVLVTGEWYHIVCVFNRTANLTTIYLNGVEYGLTADITGYGAISNADSFIIGHPTVSFGSNTDIIGFTKEALDINTIQNLYNKGL